MTLSTLSCNSYYQAREKHGVCSYINLRLSIYKLNDAHILTQVRCTHMNDEHIVQGLENGNECSGRRGEGVVVPLLTTNIFFKS